MDILQGETGRIMRFCTFLTLIAAIFLGCAGRAPTETPSDQDVLTLEIRNDGDLQSFIIDAGRRSLALRLAGPYSTRMGDAITSQSGEEIVPILGSNGANYTAVFLASENPSREFSLRVYDQGAALTINDGICRLLLARLTVMKRPQQATAQPLAPAFIGLEPDGRACRYRRRN